MGSGGPKNIFLNFINTILQHYITRGTTIPTKRIPKLEFAIDNYTFSTAGPA